MFFKKSLGEEVGEWDISIQMTDFNGGGVGDTEMGNLCN